MLASARDCSSSWPHGFADEISDLKKELRGMDAAGHWVRPSPANSPAAIR